MESLPGQLTFWPEEPPAKAFPSPDSDADWTTRVATWPSDSSSLLECCGRPGSSGKTSPVSCRVVGDGTLVPSSGRWATSGMGSPIEFWTLSGLESPSVADVCSLLDTLETGDVPQRYFLSAKACAGILRRAERRGKALPEQLLRALLAVGGALLAQESPEDRTT